MQYHQRPEIASSVADQMNSVAVIGLACRFPGDATNGAEFWKLLCNARSAYSESDRFNMDGFHGTRINTSTPKGGHFLSQDVAAFDANFFSISQNEAMAMDPQQRLMLEVAYEAFENAGLPLEAIAGTDTSCYIGNYNTDYREMLFRDPDTAPLYSMSGSGSELLSNRVSWFYDLRGPSFTLGTACSSSLVALHQGCQSLRTGESNMAIVGGSNLMLNPDMFIALSNQKFLSQGGRCRSFDAGGDGYGRGEGFAAVILKRVSDAVRDGDPIRAVIRGTAVNQDGKTKAITVPSAEAQANLIRLTYRLAGLEFKDTHYFEAHGTGTKAGDPLELEGISTTLCSVRKPGNNLIVGSVKSNIGHLESAAGLAALIKGIYILENAMIPPNINFQQPNPKVPFAKWNIKVPTRLTPWPQEGLRRLSIQAFGYGGTNAHAIIDDAFHYLTDRNLKGIHFTKPSKGTKTYSIPMLAQGDPPMLIGPTKDARKLEAAKSQKRLRLFTFSAQDKDGLARQRDNFSSYLQDHRLLLTAGAQTEDLYLRDLAFTLSDKRSRLAWKSSVAASSTDELVRSLENKISDIPAFRSTGEPRVGFIFTGQGAQWAQMGMELFQYRVFRESIERADEYLRSALGCTWSAAEEICRDEATSNINLPAYSQPLCTVLQIALVDLLESWNVVPSVIAGHSSGEIAGAYCLGALIKEDALKIAYFRGLLSSQMKTFSPSLYGSMLAVGASEEEAQSWISRHSDGKVVVACVNSPSSVTLSGDTSGIEEMHVLLKEAGIFARKLKVDTAYHSPHMEIISVPYLEAMRDILMRPARESRKFYSALSGALTDADELGPLYWVRNLTSPVLFYDAVLELLLPVEAERQNAEPAVDLLLEIGPHSALRGPINQIMKRHGIKGVDCQSIISRGQSGVQTALAAAGALFVQGVRVDVSQVNNDKDNAFGGPPRPLVDLPPYSWNHSRTFWAESRISKQYRFRKHPPRSLLGAPHPSNSETERLWRGFLRISEEPWVRDHKIQSSILYPAAGYIAMAIEAAYEMAAPGQIIRDFRMRDVNIIAPAVITEESNLECILQLRPHLSGTRDESYAWQEFTVSTCDNGHDLRKNCYGLLQIEYQSAEETRMSLEKRLEDQASKERYTEAERLCQTPEDPIDFYRDLASVGLNYGPTFQNITRIRGRNGQSCCAVTISDPGSSEMCEKMERPHVIHPSNLDAMFHAVFAAFKHQKGQMKDAMVPKSIDEIIISASIPFEIGTQFKGYSNVSKHGFRELMADLVMLDESLIRPVVTVKGFCCAAISGTGETEDAGLQSNAGKLYSELIWKPAIEFCSPDESRSMISAASPGVMSPESSKLLAQSETLALFYIRRAMEQLPVGLVPTPHLQDLYNWMKEQLTTDDTRTNPLPILKQGRRGVDQNEAEYLQAEVRAGSMEGQALCHIGNSIEQIVLGKVDAAELLREIGLLDPVFAEPRGMDECLRKMSEFLNLTTHADPDVSILELGASNGGAASSIFLSGSTAQSSSPQTLDYTFTSSNGSILKKAEEHLQLWKDRVKFKTLAIDRDLSSQGFENAAFDVIVVSNLLLSAENPSQNLAKLRKLLKPGGKLCLVHFTNPSIGLSLVLRCLPSWKSQEQKGHHLGLMGEEPLDSLLKHNGFATDFRVADFEDSLHQQLSVTVATTGAGLENGTSEHEITILETSSPSMASQNLASRLASELEDHGIKVKRTKWGPHIAALKIKECISLLELDTPFLFGLGKDDFASLQQVIIQCPSLLWTTALDDPAGGLVSGMARSIRNEMPGKRFRTLSVRSKSLASPDRLAALVRRLATKMTADDEFQEEDGVLNICRVVDNTSMNEEMSRLLSPEKDIIDLMSLEQADGPQKLAIRAQGMLDTICVEGDNMSTSDLGDDELEIEVKATGLNFRDVMVAMGQIPDNLLGFEASGIVSRVGKDVLRFSAGDRVCTLGHGAHRTLFRNKAQFCQPIPVGLSFEEAATIPLVHCTAFYSLVHIARVRRGQTILIHAAAGGVGQAAIQLARHFGLEIYATVGSQEKRQLIEEVYGIEPDHIFNSRDLSFAKGVMRMTKGRGVDCIINSLSGEALRQSWHCIAPFGNFVEIGMKDILSNTGLEMRPFLQDASFTFLNMKHVLSDNPDLMAEIIDGTFDFLRRGIIKPVSPVTVYPISDAENAFRLLQTGKHRGKVALRWAGTDVVPVLHRVNSSLILDQNATYLLVGGLGGLGRSLANLLADHGARHLCFISRSGDASESAQKLIRDLDSRKVQITVYSCDVADEDSLAHTLRQCSETMPAVKGVFQCAMVLRDNLFERMNYEQWTSSLRPKVQGSWNLSTLLPRDLDFHITLSSFTGIFGSRSQSNYAAGGAYQDALAHHRRAQGLKAVTVDLGIMRDVGVMAEQGATDYLEEWTVPFGMREGELHVLMKKIIASEMKGEGKVPPQIINGLATGEAALAAGVRRPFYFNDARFSILASSGASTLQDAPSAANGTATLREQLGLVDSLASAARAVTDALVARVAKSLQTDRSEIDESRPLHSYGIDSLVGVEIANWVFKETKVSVTVFDILATQSISSFARNVAEKSPFVPKEIEEK